MQCTLPGLAVMPTPAVNAKETITVTKNGVTGSTDVFYRMFIFCSIFFVLFCFKKYYCLCSCENTNRCTVFTTLNPGTYTSSDLRPLLQNGEYHNEFLFFSFLFFLCTMTVLYISCGSSLMAICVCEEVMVPSSHTVPCLVVIQQV